MRDVLYLNKEKEVEVEAGDGKYPFADAAVFLIVGAGFDSTGQTVLAPDECDSLAAALVQAAARKRSEDEAKKLEEGR